MPVFGTLSGLLKAQVIYTFCTEKFKERFIPFYN